MEYNYINNFEYIENENQFMDDWDNLQCKMYAEVRPGGKPIKHKNWKKLNAMKEELVKIWDDKFRETIIAIVCNNTNPKNFNQFMDFELK